MADDIYDFEIRLHRAADEVELETLKTEGLTYDSSDAQEDKWNREYRKKYLQFTGEEPELPF